MVSSKFVCEEILRKLIEQSLISEKLYLNIYIILMQIILFYLGFLLSYEKMSGHKQPPHNSTRPVVPGSTKCLLFQNSQLPLTKFHQREPNSLRPFSRHTKLQRADCRCFFSEVHDPFTECSVLSACCHFPPEAESV